MEKETFAYSYSAKESTEIQAIRKRYETRDSDKLIRLRKLDEKVLNAGMVEALCTGITGALVFGLGFCLCLGIFGSGSLNMVAGILTGLVGMVPIAWAYPVYCKVRIRTKEKYAPEILQLIAELTGENTENKKG